MLKSALLLTCLLSTPSEARHQSPLTQIATEVASFKPDAWSIEQVSKARFKITIQGAQLVTLIAHRGADGEIESFEFTQGLSELRDAAAGSYTISKKTDTSAFKTIREGLEVQAAFFDPENPAVAELFGKNSKWPSTVAGFRSDLKRFFSGSDYDFREKAPLISHRVPVNRFVGPYLLTIKSIPSEKLLWLELANEKIVGIRFGTEDKRGPRLDPRHPLFDYIVEEVEENLSGATAKKIIDHVTGAPIRLSDALEIAKARQLIHESKSILGRIESSPPRAPKPHRHEPKVVR